MVPVDREEPDDLCRIWDGWMSGQNRRELPAPGWEPLAEGYSRNAAKGRFVVQRPFFKSTG